MFYLYLRISNEKLSFENQINKLTEYVKNKNIELKNIIKDISNGFRKEEGNCLYDLLNSMKRGDYLITYNISRISRDTNNLVQFFQLIKDKDINLIFVENSNEEHIIKNSVNSLNIILSNITELDAEYISLITKNALQDLKDKGIKLGAPKKYGKDFIKKVKDFYNSGQSMQTTAMYFGISSATVYRFVNDNSQKTITSENLNNVAIETKLSIWADNKLGITKKELAIKYNLSIDIIDKIIKSLKGGAHW